MVQKSEIQDIYPLSSMQEGMLFHSLLDESLYIVQLFYAISGDIKLELFQESFNMLIQRHDILRTVFVYEKVKRPLQILLHKRINQVHYVDITHLNAEEQEKYIEKYRIEDKKRGFELSKGPLIRLTLFKVGEGNYMSLWSFHHILMDGWCSAILVKEFKKMYLSLINGQPLNLSPIPPYSSYIKWLEAKDQHKAKEYWENYLESYTNLTTLPEKLSKVEAAIDEEERVSFTIDSVTTAKLQGIARNLQVTLNTVFQALWGVLLQRYNNTLDVVFGTIVSVRPADLVGVEHMMGMFINTVPIRVKCTEDISFTRLVQEVHADTLQMAEFNHYPLAEIKGIGVRDAELFTHLMAFQNYPIAEENNTSDQIFKMRRTKSCERANYDFTFILVPGNEITVILSYNSLVYEDEFVKMVESNLTKGIGIVTENPEICIEDIAITDEEEDSFEEGLDNLEAMFDF